MTYLSFYSYYSLKTSLIQLEKNDTDWRLKKDKIDVFFQVDVKNIHFTAFFLACLLAILMVLPFIIMPFFAGQF